MEHGYLTDVVLLLAAGVFFVPLFKKLGLGSVLGYLVAGVLLGPWGFGLISEPDRMSAVSELGVVFLLFIIGLELEPKRLWAWRTSIFGMGTLQVFLVGSGVALLAKFSGLAWNSAVVLGAAAAMSSTAIASQILRERNLLNTKGGSSAFSILLFQDIAVLPVLALLPHLAGQTADQTGVPAWLVLLVIAAIVLAGRILLRHVLRMVAGAHLREVFTAMSLLVVVGMAALMEQLGVSMALGAFVAGVLLATSEYRHAIEMDIEPFKGILLGLFFLTVGMSVDLTVLSQNLPIVVALLGLVLAFKMAVHLFLARAFGISFKERPLFAVLIAQVGEFAFVLFTNAQAIGLLNPEQSAILSATVALSMASTPLMLLIYDYWIAPKIAGMSAKVPAGAEVRDDHPEVLIAGFGRVGQIVGRLLYANGVTATVLDHDPDQIELLRKFGFKIYFGDATRLDLLEAAGAGTAKVLVVAVDDTEDSLEIVDLAQAHFPHLQIVARARNVGHVYDLIDRGVAIWERETFESSLRMSAEVLKTLGWEPYAAVRAANKFREHNVKMIHQMHVVRDDESKLVSAARQARADLEKMFNGERENLKRNDDGFDVRV